MIDGIPNQVLKTAWISAFARMFSNYLCFDVTFSKGLDQRSVYPLNCRGINLLSCVAKVLQSY